MWTRSGLFQKFLLTERVTILARDVRAGTVAERRRLDRRIKKGPSSDFSELGAFFPGGRMFGGKHIKTCTPTLGVGGNRKNFFV
jgi:hypothetical protein